MTYIFINLKRFDVSRSMGGICPMDDASQWITEVMKESIALGMGKIKDSEVTYFLPESLLITSQKILTNAENKERANLTLGSQSLYRKDVQLNGNFGAFTSNLPAAVPKSIGCEWSIIGHSEERNDKFEIIEQYDTSVRTDETKYKKAMTSVNKLISEEISCALKQNLNVLLCIGESSSEKGEGLFQEQQERIKEVLKTQLVECLADNLDLIKNTKVVIGYEPIWAIGPGKTPPGKEYISFVSQFIKDCAEEEFGIIDIPVVYGGGLKESNAEMISSISTINGGLIALTNFEPPIGFNVGNLKKIVDKYI